MPPIHRHEVKKKLYGFEPRILKGEQRKAFDGDKNNAHLYVINVNILQPTCMASMHQHSQQYVDSKNEFVSVLNYYFKMVCVV